MKDISELKEACELLGLNPSEFIEVPEVSKGVDNNIDYKQLYETQKGLNTQIIEGIGRLPKILSESLSTQIKEVQKSVTDIKDRIEQFEQSPLHQRKSVSNMAVIEKSLNNNSENIKDTYSLSNRANVKALKQFLGNKTLECLQKGINNSIYEKAAMQLDANKVISQDVADKLFEVSKIKVIN